jgi:2-polyprenyl-3-methyl-5-hydroxy-6-metoxy-1,4-benzoquinol methylase
MCGDFAALAARNAALFERLGLDPGRHGPIAIDLGAGHGAQSVPLAARGFEVVAIDFCAPLLEELQRNAGALPITTVEADLLEFRQHVAADAGVVVCMGDTLPHLPSLAAVEQLIHDTADVLANGGVFVASFRDYVSRKLIGEARFIPVRADEHLILTCFLEYADDTVTVHDLLHERVDGAWRQSVSSYRKLRLDPAWLVDACRRAGLTPDQPETEGGLITFVARKP